MGQTVELTPSDSMATAAGAGLELATAGKGGAGIEPATKARARKIAAKEPLTAAHVNRMHTFFSEHAADRKTDWGKPGNETTGFVSWQLWGGDAGKAWAAGKMKALTGAGVEMDEETHEVVEMFFGDELVDAADPNVKMDDDGLIWKPMLPVGVWKVGPNGRPLKVVAGKSPDQRRAIGMKDIIAAFDAKALAHVTIPKTHVDAVDENTGFIRKLKVDKHKGVMTLFGGHDFTDASIKGKVMDGSIANTSVGLEFDYVRKDDGKKFPVVLRHNALTNRPWLGRKLAPFGLEEQDGVSYNVMCGEYSEQFADEAEQIIDLWDNALTYAEIRDALVVLAECEVVDLGVDRVLLKDDGKSFVAKFIIEDGDVKLDERDKWVERVVTPLEDDHTDPVDDKATSGAPSTLKTSEGVAPDDKTKTKEKAIVPEEDKDKETKGTPAVTVALADDPAYQAQLAENATLKVRLDQLVQKDRKRDADDFIVTLKNMGLDEKHGCTGFLKKTRDLLLADTGETAILLAESEGATPTSMTLGEVVRDLLGSLPLGEDGKVKIQLTEQQTDPLGLSGGTKPPAQLKETKEGEEVSLADKQSAADEWAVEMGLIPATTTKES
jgi:hypothetical protein